MRHPMLSIRPYRPADLPQLAALFYDTVHTVCSAHYTPEECDAWAPAERDLTPWAKSLGAHLSLVAELHGSIVGFADADIPASYLDRLYIHRDFLRQGIATALCEALESAARAAGVSTLTSHASITALPFFCHRGYAVLRANQAACRGLLLANYVVQKQLSQTTL